MQRGTDPLAAFDYVLPPDCIAQRPLVERDAARLLVLDRTTGATRHAHVRDLPDLVAEHDCVVGNATRVLPARLRGHKASGGRAEALLLGSPPGPPDRQRALVRCRGRLRPGLEFVFERDTRTLRAEVETIDEAGEVVLRFAPGASPYALGETPLPPYIRREAADPADAQRYQTVFAREAGSVAAPTAGLHLTPALLARLGERWNEVVLHVGVGTFRPLAPQDLAAGRLHAEAFELPPATASAIARTRDRGGRVVAVGTTTTRVLESCATADGRVAARRGETDLLLQPGSAFRVADALLTNFHLPRSSLLVLVAAFAGRERILEAYAEAIAGGYRFYSYGDAMLIH